jgi:competence protein ComEC
MHADLPNPAQRSHGLTTVPLFHAAWLFAAGILVASRMWLQPPLVLILLILVAALCGAAVRRGGHAQGIVWLPLAVLWILLGAWCGEMEPQPAPALELAAVSDGLLRTVEGTVVDAGPVRTELEQNVDEPSVTAPTQRIDVRVATVEVVNDASDAQAPVAGEVRLTVRWPGNAEAQGAARPFRCGERVRAVVRLLRPETYHDPGVWSRADYLLDQGITSTATVATDRVERLRQAPGAFLSCRVGGWQHASTTRLLALPAAMRNLPAPLRLSEDDAVMLAAMVAGDRTYLTHLLRVGFERTGSFHMLVVSGFHLAIVAACIFWITRRLRMPRVPATILTIVASFAYALFTGFATPVQRSLWMVTLYLLGRLVYRERSPLNTIGFAALCLLVVSPHSLFDSSLQMTLLAVIAIAGVAAPLLQGTIHPYAAAMRDLQLVAVDIKLAPRVAEFRMMMRTVAERLERAGNGVIAWRIFPWSVRFAIRAVELVVVSCVVELAMTLPMAVYFHRITIFCSAGESADFADAVGVDARGTRDNADAGGVAGGRSGSGNGGGARDAHRGGAGASVRVDGARRLQDSQSASVAIGGVLRAARSGDCFGARELCARGTLAETRCMGCAGDGGAGGSNAAAGGSAEGRDADGGDRCGPGRLAACDYARRKDAAGGWRWIRRGAEAGASGFRHRRGGGVAGAVGAGHPAPGRGGAEPCALRPHGRIAGHLAQLPSR